MKHIVALCKTIIIDNAIHGFGGFSLALTSEWRLGKDHSDQIGHE